MSSTARTQNRLPIVVATILTLALAACGGGAEEPIPVEPDGGIGDGAGPPPEAGVDLEITIEHPDIDAHTYRITCADDSAVVEGSDAIVADDACAQLAQESVQERLVEGPPEDRVCTEVYGGPDTATIVGSIDGRPVDTVIDRTNGCGIAEWDQLLSQVLPPAIGVSG